MIRQPMPDAVVIPLRAEDAEPEAPLRQRKKGRARYCGHRQVEVDDAARRVYCTVCGAEVDAFDTLSYLAHHFERYVDALEAAKQRAEAAQAELRELLREERNAKARRARRRGG